MLPRLVNNSWTVRLTKAEVSSSVFTPLQILYTVVPALGEPRRERPPAVYGHFVNVPTHFNVKLPLISGHLPNADADSHLLVVNTCYIGQYKQMWRFRWSFQPEIAGAHPNLGPTVRSNFRAVVWWPTSNMSRHRDWLTTWLRQINPFIGYVCFTTSTEKSRILFVQPAMLKNRTILSLDQRIEMLCRLSEAHHVER